MNLLWLYPHITLTFQADGTSMRSCGPLGEGPGSGLGLRPPAPVGSTMSSILGEGLVMIGSFQGLEASGLGLNVVGSFQGLEVSGLGLNVVGSFQGLE